MRRAFVGLLVIMCFCTLGVRGIAALEVEDNSSSFLGFFVDGLSALYTAVAVHEYGHYSQAEESGVSSKIRIGIIKSKTV